MKLFLLALVVLCANSQETTAVAVEVEEVDWCWDNSDCYEGATCDYMAEECVYTDCDADGDCGVDEVCDGDGYCVVRTCYYDTDCTRGSVCEGHPVNECVAEDDWEEPGCYDNYDCSWCMSECNEWSQECDTAYWYDGDNNVNCCYDYDCASDEVCNVDGMCVTGVSTQADNNCYSDIVCPSTYYCSMVDNTCWVIFPYVMPCQGNDDCQTGYLCYTDECELDYDTAEECDDSYDCDTSYYCGEENLCLYSAKDEAFAFLVLTIVLVLVVCICCCVVVVLCCRRKKQVILVQAQPQQQRPYQQQPMVQQQVQYQ